MPTIGPKRLEKSFLGSILMGCAVLSRFLLRLTRDTVSLKVPFPRHES